MDRVGLVALAIMGLTLAGCSSVLGPPPAVSVTEGQRRECERNGGYWSTAAGMCRIGA
jgi:hypothetical protein